MPEILTSVSTQNNKEFAVKMFIIGKKAKIISQKLAMVGVHMYKGYKIKWDTQMVEVKPPKVIEYTKTQSVNQITNESLKDEYSKVFKTCIRHGNNNFP